MKRDLPGTKVQIKPTYSKEDQTQLKKDLMLAGGTRAYKIKILRSFKVIYDKKLFTINDFFFFKMSSFMVI